MFVPLFVPEKEGTSLSFRPASPGITPIRPTPAPRLRPEGMAHSSPEGLVGAVLITLGKRIPEEEKVRLADGSPAAGSQIISPERQEMIK